MNYEFEIGKHNKNIFAKIEMNLYILWWIVWCQKCVGSVFIFWWLYRNPVTSLDVSLLCIPR